VTDTQLVAGISEANDRLRESNEKLRAQLAICVAGLGLAKQYVESGCVLDASDLDESIDKALEKIKLKPRTVISYNEVLKVTIKDTTGTSITEFREPTNITRIVWGDE